MAYTKFESNWENFEAGGTPITEAALDHIETGIVDAAADADAAQATADGAVPKSVVDAAGDLIVGSGADAVTRLAKGSDGTWLKVSGGALLWSAISGADLTDGTVTAAKLTIPYADYTPVWTSTGTQPALGNGTAVGRFVQIGKFVHCTGTVTFGTTSTFGTGAYFFSLPVASAGIDNLGVGQGVNQGVAIYTFVAVPSAADKFQFNVTASPSSQVTNTTPFTWGSTDYVVWSVFYEAA